MQQVKLDDMTGVIGAVRSLQTQVTSILAELQAAAADQEGEGGC